MTVTMYAAAIPPMLRMLDNLSAILDKATAHAEAKKIDPEVLLGMRLSPDMWPLLRQVRATCDFAKATVARLAGREPVKWEDDEKTFGDLKGRIARARDLLHAAKASEFEGAEKRDVTFATREGPVTMKGADYLSNVAFPNFYFHATAVYAILRHAGVSLGKADFLGRP
ncbi:MAG: DUF1993 domain-containing protein [Pseudomonadota bacterium]|nr:DUF1993 domain-containing protein [Pseudomonadota bacterium]